MPSESLRAHMAPRPQEFSRTVSTAEGQAFAASRDPPWMFMECSAKKGGEDVSGADGIFSRVVDKVRRGAGLSRSHFVPGLAS